MKGTMVDSIWVDTKLKESYSLYTPASYDPSKPSPVIFIFEPMARGKIGIEPFILTAETYGYILVCSNNSKNGPYELNYAIANRLFDKVFSTLNLDKKRIYTSGFSGGGRLASSIAIKSELIQGVVSCGAAFYLDFGNLPMTQRFSYATIMGDEDMNYYELAFTRKYLTKINLPYEVFTFNITHRWPSQDQILMAFDWMQLEAYKNLLMPIDTAIIKQTYHKFYDHTRAKEINNDLLASVNEYRRILNSFNRYYQLDSIKEKVKSISQSQSYKSQKKKNEEILETEMTLTIEYLNRINKDIENNSLDLDWWGNHIEKLKKKQTSKSIMAQKMYKRFLYRLYAHAIESVNYTDNENSIEQQMFCYDLCILIYPKYPVPYIKQIELFIAQNKTEEALDNLEKLLNSGYNNKEYLLGNSTIQTLKNNDRFKILLNQI